MQPQEALRSRLIDLTRDLVIIPSASGRQREIQRCLEFISNHLERIEGIELRRLESGGHESLVALPQGVQAPAILLCGHIDVIDHPQDDCYHSQIVDGRIVGPGAGDMKGQDAIMIELFRNLHARHPGISLGLALTSDEEIGGFHGTRYLCEEVGLRCDCAIIPDGGSLRDITIEEKGVLHLRIRRHGQEAHGARPWLGENAVERLVEQLVPLKAHFAQFWPAEEIEEQRNHWFPTCSITAIHTPNETANRIPCEAEALLDIRFPPPVSVASMYKQVEAFLADCEIECLMTAEPTQLNPDPLFCQLTAEVTGQEVRYVRASGGSDSRFFREYEIPVNLSRPLVGKLHAVDEWIDIDSMLTYYQICERYILEKLSR